MTVIDLKTMREAEAPPASVVCLGNFDGIHKGHLALIRETISKKEELCQTVPLVASGVCFFRVPPSEYILSSSPPQITTFDQKLRLFADAGLDYAFIVDFLQVGSLSPAEFVGDILQKTCHCIFAVCGFNFHFGKGARGDGDTLSQLMNGAASIVAPVLSDGKVVSSSAIRKHISDGEVHIIPRLLGRNYCICTEVVHGKALGRTLGIPTINQYFPENLVTPKRGIYITGTKVNNKLLPSVTNIGVRPSVEDGSRANCETHILAFDGNLYGKCVEIQFVKRLRDEMRFESIDELKAQIHRDIVATKTYYKEASFL